MNPQRRIEKLTAILDVAKAMTVEYDLDALLTLILKEAKGVVDADRCTIFVLDSDSNTLWSRIAQGLTTQEIRLPMGQGIAGQVAEHNQVLNIADAYADGRFNRTIDEETGYSTKSILCAPMRGARGEIVGVIEALNRVDSRPFDEEDEELLVALGGQAASAIQNALLHEAIVKLFEGFVRASIFAIESRDPTTSGHSERVAKLSIALAQRVNSSTNSRFATVHFSSDELRELRYAALLHDFGKVGVREQVLVKENKLLADQLQNLEMRFAIAKKGLERDYYQRLMELGTTADETGGQEAQLRQELETSLSELDEIWAFIQQCNCPTPRLDDSCCRKLHRIAQLEFPGVRGTEPLLTSREVEQLSIPIGSLAPDERQEIESHVIHTFRFLQQIPWTKDLSLIPDIAHAHHEKLDGSGYPRALEADQISLGPRIITIADIYDALTAQDRPYKRAMSHDVAIKVLLQEASRGLIDEELLHLFIDADIARTALHPTST